MPPRKKSSSKQQKIDVEQFTLLKKPLDQLGKQPGSFWKGRMSAEERTTNYKCTVLTDPNLDPAYLAMLVRVGFNKKVFKPLVKAIKDKYYEMFRGKNGPDEGEEEVESAPSAAGPSSDNS